MCGRYTVTVPVEVLAELFELAEAPALERRFNVAPTQEAPVVRAVAGPAGPARRLDLLRWGLVPWWADDPSIGNRLINARAESAADKPAFRDPFRRRRCLVVADGFYEWEKRPTGRQPYWIHRPDGRPLAFAGLWSRWRRGERRLDSFTILTRPAPRELAALHDRVPAILPPEDWPLWLDPAARDPELLHAILGRAGDPALEARPVGPRVNRPEHDDPACIEALVAPPTDGALPF